MFKEMIIKFRFIALLIVCTLVVSLFSSDLFRVKESQASMLGLPEPSKLLLISQEYDMPTLKGIKVDLNNPLKLQFIVDSGSQNKLSQEESELLLSYFLAALTTPNDDLWVNLSPYESDRVIPQKLGITELGRDMLAQDYILKQLSASLTHPDTQSGKTYWSIENQESGIENLNALNKIWIIPDQAKIYENNGTALITHSSLDVKTEADYLAHAKNNLVIEANRSQDSLLPFIKQELNNGKHFAKVRQIYNSTILAMWFKNKLKDTFYSQYIDQDKISGVDLDDHKTKDKIFNLYCEAFKKGVYKINKKEKDALSQKTFKKQYFGGGLTLSSAVLDIDNNDDVVSTKKIQTMISHPKLLDLNLSPIGTTMSSNIVKKSFMAILLSSLSLFALDLVKGTPNTIGILKDNESAAQIMWDAQGNPHVYNSRGAANQFAPNNPYEMWSWGQFMNMITPLDSIDDDLSQQGHNSNKVYYAAENLNSSDKAKLKTHINKIYRESKMATMLMHFGGQYATNGKDNFLLANPTAANLDVVRERVRDFARFCNELDFGALSGVQLFNEPMFYQQGASSMHWGDAHYAQIGFNSAEEFYDFANELAGIFKSICPNVPVYYGHGFLEPTFISKIKGRLSNFDAIALNLYPNFPMGNNVMSVADLVNYFREQIRLAYQELGLPVVISEFAESSTSKNNDPNWGEDDQAQFAANVIRALGLFMLGSDSEELKTVIGVFWHELFPEAWKDAAIAPTESGLSLYTKDYGKKLAADSLGQGYIRIDSLENNIETPVNTTIKNKKTGFRNRRVNKVLVLNSSQNYINDSFDVPVTVKIHDLKGRLIGRFDADNSQKIDPYIARLNLPDGNYIIDIEPMSSSIIVDPIEALDNALELFALHSDGIIERKQVHVQNVNNFLKLFLNREFEKMNPEKKGTEEYKLYNQLLNDLYDKFISFSAVEQNSLILGTVFHDIGSRDGVRDMDHDFAGARYIHRNLPELFEGNIDLLRNTAFIIKRHSMMSNVGTDTLAWEVKELSDYHKFALTMVNFFDVGARADGTNLYTLDLLQDLLAQAYEGKGEQIEDFANYRVKNAFCPKVMQSYAISNRLDDSWTKTITSNYNDILDNKLRVRSFGLFTQLISLDTYAYLDVLVQMLQAVSSYDLDEVKHIIVDTDIDFMALPVAKMTKVAKEVYNRISLSETLDFVIDERAEFLRVTIKLDEIAESVFGGIEFSDIEIEMDSSSAITDINYIDLGEFTGLKPVDIQIRDIEYEDIINLVN